VVAEVFNIRGQRIRCLVDGVRGSGYHELLWDARDENGIIVNSGAYFLVFRIDGRIYSRKILMLK
jgi:hypothetical protein